VFFLVSVALLIGVYLIVAALERTPALRFRRLASPRRYLATDTAWFAVGLAATAISAFVFRPQLAKLAIAPLARRLHDLPPAAKFLIALVVFDFVSFTVHVALHRSAALWNVHKVHHSTLELDGFATTRAHMLENLVRFVPGQALLFLMGMPATVVTPTVAIYAIFGVSNHSNIGIDLRWAEPLLVTPRLHRRHHIPDTSQNNFGTVFTVWDRLIGRLLPRDTTDEERFGVPGEVDTYPQHFAAAFRQPLVQTRQQLHDKRGARSVPSELEQLRGEEGPAFEETARSRARGVAALDPLGVAPRRLDELRAGDEPVQELGSRAGVVRVAPPAAKDERR
jgi:sterol desaturase/sphingolipid hydroxylase (fatty acid hydroxylase superfamily)